MRPAVFLDRDDTLIANRDLTAGTAHPGDLFDPALVRLLPGVAAACRALARAGYSLVVVSNQGAVARGRCTIAQVRATNDRLRAALRSDPEAGPGGVNLAGVYFCPYHPNGVTPPFNIEHDWRKPAPGMILSAATDLALDLRSSWIIGDAERDVNAGRAAGLAPERCLLIGAAARFPGMPEAAAHILASARA